MKIEFNRATWYSKIASIIIFFGLIPVLVFYIGREYEKTLAVYDEESITAENNYSSSNYVFSHRDSTTGEFKYDSGIKGMVLVGPTCPVVQAGSEEQCADRPLAVKIKFINQYGSATTTTSAADGSYKIMLAPGDYTIMNGGDAFMPSLSPVRVMVNEDEYTNIDLSYDSGIR